MEPLNPSYQTWIAENLLNGCTSEQLVQVMIGLDISPEQAQAEIDAALNHPYMQAALAVGTTLKKREALLKTLDWYNRMDPEYLQLPSRELPPFATYLKEYYYPNRPGLFRGAANHWPAMQWTPRNLLEKIGAETMVEIQHGRETDHEYEIKSAQFKHQMRFREFIDKVENTVSNDFYLTANNFALENSVFRGLAADVGNLGDGYLDAAQTAKRMFLWIGPQGTITPLHHDLTHNIFVQVYGQKRFRLIPAMQVPYVYNHQGVFCRVDLLNPDLQQFPLFANVTPIDVTLGPGDFLHIPNGWLHHVVAESVSISLSFTNVNAPNNFIDYPSSY